jgi:hypothetical protein
MADLDEERKRVKEISNLWIGIAFMLTVCIIIFRKNITDWKECTAVLAVAAVILLLLKIVFVALYDAYEDWLWKDK